MVQILLRAVVGGRKVDSIVRQSYRCCSTATNKLKLTFSSGENKVFDGALVSQVDVTTTEGDFGILKNHVPVVVELLPGVVSVKNDANVDNYFVSSGFVSVGKDSNVQIFAADVTEVKNLDGTTAQKLVSEYDTKVQSAATDEQKNYYKAAHDVAKRIVDATKTKM